MNIKILEEDHWSAFRTLRLKALHDYPEAFGSSFEEESMMPEDEFRAIFKTCDVFGCFMDTILVGCAVFFVRSLLLKMRHRGVLCAVYTDPYYRKKGVADALVKEVIGHAKKQVMQLHLTVVATNLTALRLYERNGFRIYGTEPHSLKIGDQFYDEQMMVLEFHQ